MLVLLPKVLLLLGRLDLGEGNSEREDCERLMLAVMAEEVGAGNLAVEVDAKDEDGNDAKAEE